MDELARVDPRANERALAVVFPRTACSGSASGVVVDDRGRFLGAVAPGTAALLTIPAPLSSLTIFSSVEVTAPVGVWHLAERVTVPPAPAGLVLRTFRWSARECASGHYFDVQLASKDEIEEELATSTLAWLAPVDAAGQAWLQKHHRRVAEVLTTPPRPPPGDITPFILR